MTQLTPTHEGPGAGCPVSGLGAEYRPFDHWSMYPLFERARKEEPVFFCPEINYWVVTRREDVLSVFRDPDRFSSAISLAPVKPLAESVLTYLQQNGYGAEATQVSCDRPRHTRIRQYAGQLLSAKEFHGLGPEIRRLVREAADAIAGNSRVDMMADFAHELPARVLFLILGIPDEDTPKIKQWADDRLLFTFGDLDEAGQQRAAERMLDYWKYCVRMVEDRKKHPRHDYASRLLGMRAGDDARLTENEVASLVFGVLLAGHETTTNMTLNAIHALLTHRDAWDAICADPSLIPNAVEECLRTASSVVCFRRRTLQDVEIAGVSIPEGANILLAMGSANYDESQYENPTRFDIRRENARTHLSFGNGIHFCLGAPLARLELQIILEELTRRWPNMRLADDALPEMIRTIAFRGPTTLWVELGGRPSPA